MARRLTAADLAATEASASDYNRMKMSRGGTLDNIYSGQGNPTSIGGGGPGEDAPALRALKNAFLNIEARGAGQGFSEENPYVAHAVEGARAAQMAGINSKAAGGLAATPADLASGRRANDAFAYENAKKRTRGFAGLDR